MILFWLQLKKTKKDIGGRCYQQVLSYRQVLKMDLVPVPQIYPDPISALHIGLVRSQKQVRTRSISRFLSGGSRSDPTDRSNEFSPTNTCRLGLGLGATNRSGGLSDHSHTFQSSLFAINLLFILRDSSPVSTDDVFRTLEIQLKKNRQLYHHQIFYHPLIKTTNYPIYTL